MQPRMSGTGQAFGDPIGNRGVIQELLGIIPSWFDPCYPQSELMLPIAACV